MSFRPGTSSKDTGTLIQITISGRKLRDMDVFSKSDPLCCVYIQPFGTKEWVNIARTETIYNDLNPNFTTKVEIMYFFEQRQILNFRVYDEDSSSSDLDEQDFIGQGYASLASIVSAPSGFSVPLENHLGVNGGTLLLRSEELVSCKDEVLLKFVGKKLDKKDFFGSSDPFLEFYRSSEDGTYDIVHRTEYISRNRNPVWKEFRIRKRLLCNADEDRNILVKCYDHNKNGSHSLIGQFSTTLRHLLKPGVSGERTFELINPKKAKKLKYKHSGIIHLVESKTIPVYSFLDYIRGGTELACTFSIDFTGSNGDPSLVESLHYVDPTNYPNAYETALRSVGEIIEEYDSDKLFPVLGFGARLPPDGRVSHLFFVNGDGNNPYCHGIDGVVSAYKSCIRRIQLFGPTNFAPSIEHVASYAKNFRDGSQYFILLIITDGVITDMPQTKRAIINASNLPLSIIIIGVGNANFDSMEELDGDEERLNDGRVYASRDIVQFVPLNKFLRLSHGNHYQVRQELAKEVLSEIPRQFLSFMSSNNLIPKPNNAQIILPTDPELTTGIS